MSIYCDLPKSDRLKELEDIIEETKKLYKEEQMAQIDDYLDNEAPQLMGKCFVEGAGRAAYMIIGVPGLTYTWENTSFSMYKYKVLWFSEEDGISVKYHTWKEEDTEIHKKDFKKEIEEYLGQYF